MNSRFSFRVIEDLERYKTSLLSEQRTSDFFPHFLSPIAIFFLFSENDEKRGERERERREKDKTKEEENKMAMDDKQR